jgi:hypothetical protein
MLNAIWTALRAGPMTIDELEAAVLPASTEPEQLEVLRKFIGHLASLGVVQVSVPLRTRLKSWQSAGAAQVREGNGDTSPARSVRNALESTLAELEPSPRDGEGVDGYLDVYRHATATLPFAACVRLQRLVNQALRVLAVIAADASSAAVAVLAEVDDRPRPVLELLRARLQPGVTSYESQRRPRGWPRAIAAGSAYARLLGWMAAGTDGAPLLDLSPAVLDQLEVPEVAIDWPLDCLLRIPYPGAGFDAVLDEVFCAGAIDARFITALRSLHGRVPHADSYREFLDRLQQETGGTFVEILVPPLSEGAANAVRRPVYTGAWTGDADIQTYCDDDDSMPQYIPLDSITLRRTRHRLLAEANGQPIWPVYHATRSPLPPWDLLAEILLAAAPRPFHWSPHRLYNSLDAFPGHSSMPRIIVGGGIVISCGQWRISRDELWDAGCSTVAKARAMERLRRHRRLPRWIFVNGRPSTKPVPCDLESLRAIPTLERAAQTVHSSIIVTEMLPTPDQLSTSDHSHRPEDRVVSELMLRLPCDESPSALADRLAPALKRLLETGAVPTGHS